MSRAVNLSKPVVVKAKLFHKKYRGIDYMGNGSRMIRMRQGNFLALFKIFFADSENPDRVREKRFVFEALHGRK
jgi:hypothetical protein